MRKFCVERRQSVLVMTAHQNVLGCWFYQPIALIAFLTNRSTEPAAGAGSDLFRGLFHSSQERRGYKFYIVKIWFVWLRQNHHKETQKCRRGWWPFACPGPHCTKLCHGMVLELQTAAGYYLSTFLYSIFFVFSI